MPQSLSLIMDIILLCALGVTMMYAFRLSNSLNNFKAYKNEFQNLMLRLSQNIEQAHGAIDTLKKTSHQTAADLDQAISEAKYLLDELQQVNQASESMAHRIEKASQMRPAASVEPQEDVYDDEPQSSWQDTLKSPAPQVEAGNPFNIRDPDHSKDGVADLADHRDQGAPSFSSQAERDLYEALQSKK